MLNQQLSQRLLQKLSPQQIQLMKLLQVPTAALEQRIKEELEMNPALEEGEEEQEENGILSEEDKIAKEDEQADFKDEKDEDHAGEEESLDVTEYLSGEDDYSYKAETDDYDPDRENKVVPFAVANTFHDYIEEQLHMLDLNEHQYAIAEQIVGSLDDDGYLRREMEAIVDDLAFTRNVVTDEQEVEQILKMVQRFDPPGVGARNLQECLLIQIERREEKNENTELAHKILRQYFEAFTKKHYDKLLRQLNIDEPTLKEAIDEILRLNPKPGGSVEGSKVSQQVIIPDFTVTNNNGELEVTLHSRNAPDLRISEGFREMLQSYSKTKDKKQKEAVLFIKQKIDSAKWFIDAIKQRQHTLTVTMQAIVERQKEFFLSGDETKLRPMILKDIAEMTNLDISTVSRVANSKYVQTEFGTILLKFFFSESLQTDSGEEVSTREVKKILSDMVEVEEKDKPLSDDSLTELLKEKGYNIARRTVAKYREQLGIPVARLRKEL
jgi:RNA polymerase sigma-54 factor